MLTNTQDIDISILNCLSDRDVAIMSKTNKYFHDIYTSEEFWKRRIRDLYGEVYIIDKPANQTFWMWHGFVAKCVTGDILTAYTYGLHNVTRMMIEDQNIDICNKVKFLMAERGDVEMLQLLANKNINLNITHENCKYGSFNIAAVAFFTNHINVLDFLEKIDILPAISTYENIYYTHLPVQLDTMKWLNKRLDIGHLTNILFDRSVEHGIVDATKWWLDKGVKPLNSNIAAVGMSGNVTMLQLFEEYGYQLDSSTADKASDIHILEWLEKRNILPSQHGANNAVWNNNIEILEWMSHRKIYPNAYCFERCMRSDNLKGLKWVMEHKIYPAVDQINIAAEVGILEILHLCAEYGLYPDTEGANLAASFGHIAVVKWLWKNNIYVTTANNAVYNNHIDVVTWLQEKGIYPDIGAATTACRRGKINVLIYLEKKDILPDVIGANYAKKYNRRDILVWLSERSIYPTI